MDKEISNLNEKYQFELNKLTNKQQELKNEILDLEMK
jgi:hypothetical protein